MAYYTPSCLPAPQTPATSRASTETCAAIGAPLPALKRTRAPLRRRARVFLPLGAAALLCSAAVAAWRVWPASLYFNDLIEPGNELLYHYQPAVPSAPLIAPDTTGADLFEEFAAEGFHFRPPTDYWERIGNAASPFSLLRPAFTLRRTESSPPSEFGIGACDFSISTDILPEGTGIDDGWQSLPSVVALQARFSCGSPDRYEITQSGASQTRFIRLVWEMLPSESGEPARHFEMWVHQHHQLVWSLTGLMPGATASYSLTRTMQRLASGFSPLPADPEVTRLALAERDTNGSTGIFTLPTPQSLYRWTSLPPGTGTWPGGQWLTPGADTTWIVGEARLAVLTLPPDGLDKVPPSRLLSGLRQIWPALRGVSFPVIDPADAPDGKTFRALLSGTFASKPAEFGFLWHRSPQGTVMAFVIQPENSRSAYVATTPGALLNSLDLTPRPADPAAPAFVSSTLHLPLLEVLASEAHADGRPREASAFHFALFARSQRLEDLAAACGSLAAGGQMEEAIKLFDVAGARFTHTPGWEIYRTLVLARLGAGPRAHRHAMDLLSSRRFPGSLASPYLNALIESRCWPQAKAFASLLVRNDPDSAQWRLHYASILAETGERAKAIAIIHATQQTWPDDAMLGIECVQNLLRFKCLQEALGVATRVALAHPDHEQAQLVFGQCQTQLGRNEEARMAYQRALKAAPASQAARRAIASLAAVSAQSDTAFVTTAIDPVPLPAALYTGSPHAPAVQTHDPALVLSRVTGIRHQRGRLPATTVRCRVLINNAEGMSQWNTLTFPLDPSRERLALHHLNVLDPAGKVMARGNLADRYTLDSPDGTRLIHFPVPGLVPGCLIDYAVSTEGIDPASAWAYTRHSFALSSPCLADIFYVTGDTSSLTWVHSGKKEPVRSGDALIWKEELPALLNGSSSGIASLHLGTVKATWESIGRDYLEQIRHRLTADPVIRETASRITKGLTDRQQKIAALARRVRSDISYTAIEFGYRAIIPHSAAITLNNRFGDCKDHAVLLHSLLTAAGIPSHLALIHSTLPTHSDFPALSQFDHMIVALPVPGGGFDFIDPTDKFLEATPGAAPTGLTSRLSLVLDPTKPRLVATSEAEAPSVGSLERLVTIQGTYDALVTDQLSLTGPAAANLRSLLAPLPPAGHLGALRKLFGVDRLREQLQEVTFTSLRDVSLPLEARLVWHSREAIRSAPHGQHLFLSTPLADYLMFPAAFSETTASTSLLITTPVRLKINVAIASSEGTYIYPPSPAQPDGSRPQGFWSTKVSEGSLTWIAELRAGTWSGQDAAGAARFPVEALQPLRQPWLLSRKALPSRLTPAGEDFPVLGAPASSELNRLPSQN